MYGVTDMKSSVRLERSVPTAVLSLVLVSNLLLTGHETRGDSDLEMAVSRVDDWADHRYGIAESSAGDMIVTHKPNSSLLFESSNHAARLSAATLVEIHEEANDKRIPSLRWRRVTIRSGRSQGVTGWIAYEFVREVYEIRLVTFIPSPAVAIGIEQPLDILIHASAVGNWIVSGPVGGLHTLLVVDAISPYFGPRIFKGDNRSFGYNEVSYRSFQSVVTSFTPSTKPTFIGGVLVKPKPRPLMLAKPKVDFGVSAGWRPHKATWVYGQPFWWWKLDRAYTPDFGPVKLAPSPENTRVSCHRPSDNSVRVDFFLSAPNPLLKTAPAIDANISVMLKKESNATSALASGNHDGFPAYELYVNGQEIFRHDPVLRRQSPLSLFGTGSGEWTIDGKKITLAR